MHPQEIEELEYFPRTEHQNAYSLSCMETQLHDPRAERALEAGLFVVVYRADVFCPLTDAFIGMGESFVSEHETLAEAEVACNEANYRHRHAADAAGFWVRYPKGAEPVAALPVVEVDNSDIPF